MQPRLSMAELSTWELDKAKIDDLNDFTKCRGLI